MSAPQLSRRDWLQLSLAGVLGSSVSGWFEPFARAAAPHPARRRSCILLWMNGGPSQMDTFDCKPGHRNGGPFKEVQTAVPGIRISEHLPQVARCMKELAIIRSMRTREGDHERASYLLRTGYPPLGPLRHPPLGSLVARELRRAGADLPDYVSIGEGRNALSAGFLGPRYAPLLLGGEGPTAGEETDLDEGLKLRNLEAGPDVTRSQVEARLRLLEAQQRDFVRQRPDEAAGSHRAAYERAGRLVRAEAARVFDLGGEPAALRDGYGRTPFGQGCLLARRLVERGVPFVQVSLGRVPGAGVGWDTHERNFEGVRALSEILDPAFATLLSDLKQRGLLDTTTVVWMGEFGRTPRINHRAGRDHHPAAWSVVLGGGGIRGGQAVGRTSEDGSEVQERPVSVPDLLATICLALGIDPGRENDSGLGRPIRLVDRSARPVREALA